MDPTSKIAKEAFENFCDMWRYLVNDVIQVAKEILESFKNFSLHNGPNVTSPSTAAQQLKQHTANRNYFNSVFQNPDPFSTYNHRQDIKTEHFSIFLPTNLGLFERKIANIPAILEWKL